MNVMEQARAIRSAMDNAAIVLTDEQALSSKELYPKWEDLMGQTVEMGFRFRWQDKLYKTKQKSYTFESHYVPGATGTESLFEVIDEGHEGTYEDPIPYETNMEIFEGLYYSQYDVLYLCIRSSGQPLYHDLADLAGNYVEVAA